MRTGAGPTTHTRDFEDEDGVRWTAFAADAIVAHGRPGAVLAFRPADDESGAELRSTITSTAWTPRRSPSGP